MSEVELIYGCEVCHKEYRESELIKVEEIKLSQKRVFPWRICYECAEKISDAFRESEK